jgi:hypothetical protein
VLALHGCIPASIKWPSDGRLPELLEWAAAHLPNMRLGLLEASTGRVVPLEGSPYPTLDERCPAAQLAAQPGGADAWALVQLDAAGGVLGPVDPRLLEADGVMHAMRVRPGGHGVFGLGPVGLGEGPDRGGAESVTSRSQGDACPGARGCWTTAARLGVLAFAAGPPPAGRAVRRSA